MITQSILRCIIVSTVIATVASFCTITVSTGSIHADDMDAAALREHGFEDAAQWSETKASTQSRLSAIVHTFKYPGFWVFWFRGFMALFVSLLAGTVTVSVWNEKRRPANNASQVTARNLAEPER